MDAQKDLAEKRRKLLDLTWTSDAASNRRQQKSADDLSPVQVIACHEILSEAVAAVSNVHRATPTMFEKFLSAMFEDGWSSESDASPVSDCKGLPWTQGDVKESLDGLEDTVGEMSANHEASDNIVYCELKLTTDTTRLYWSYDISGEDLAADEFAEVEWYDEKQLDEIHYWLLYRVYGFMLGHSSKHNAQQAVQKARWMISQGTPGYSTGKEFFKMKHILNMFPTLSHGMKHYAARGEPFSQAVVMFENAAVRVSDNI